MNDDNIHFLRSPYMSFDEAIGKAATDMTIYPKYFRISRVAIKDGFYFQFVSLPLGDDPVLNFFVISAYHNEHISIEYKLSQQDILAHDWYVVTDEIIQFWNDSHQSHARASLDD